MTEKQILINPTKEEKKKHLVFQLVNQQESSFKKRIGKTKRTTNEAMKTSQYCTLNLASRCWDEKTQTIQDIAYVRRARTIFLNDRTWIDENGKEKTEKGLRSLYSEQALKNEMLATSSKPIYFVGGMLSMIQYANEPLLLDFILKHDCNLDAVNVKEVRGNRRLSFTTFKALQKEEDAKTQLKDIDKEMEAMTYATNMRKKLPNGDYQYNEPQLDAVLVMLGEKQRFKEGEVNQKFEIIYNHAKHNGEMFIDTIEMITNECKIQIGKAIQLKVLLLTGEAKIEKRTVLTFEGKKTEDEKINELILWFIGTHQGQQAYGEMKQLVEEALAISMAQNKR